jgi:hypothetical protein
MPTTKKPTKKVSVAFRNIYVLSVIQHLMDRKLTFLVEDGKDNFTHITVDGFITTIEAFPEHNHLIAYTI